MHSHQHELANYCNVQVDRCWKWWKKWCPMWYSFSRLWNRFLGTRRGGIPIEFGDPRNLPFSDGILPWKKASRDRSGSPPFNPRDLSCRLWTPEKPAAHMEAAESWSFMIHWTHLNTIWIPLGADVRSDIFSSSCNSCILLLFFFKHAFFWLNSQLFYFILLSTPGWFFEVVLGPVCSSLSPDLFLLGLCCLPLCLSIFFRALRCSFVRLLEWFFASLSLVVIVACDCCG